MTPTQLSSSYFTAATPGVDQIALVAVDNAGNYSDPATTTITVLPELEPAPQPVNPTDHTPPTIATGQQLIVPVGSNTTLEPSFLSVTDNNSANYSPSQLKYTITSSPIDGFLVKGGAIVTTFTQSDINNGLVEYQENGTAVTTDNFSYYVSDPAGNSTPITTFTIEIQAPSPPPPPPQVTVALADDTGPPPTGGLAASTSNATLTGSTAPNAKVVISEGTTILGSTTASSSGVWTFLPSGLADGSYFITASETNAGGQTATASLAFTLDTVTPPAPSTPQLSGGTTVVYATAPTFSGTSEANDQVFLLEGNTVIGSGTAIGGDWVITTDPLAEGYHTITAEAIDLAGNKSAVSSADTIDVIPPPPGEVVLNDATMLSAGDLSQVGTVNISTESLIEYGKITDDGFTLTNLSRTGFAFVSWNAAWAFVHNVGNVSEYYDGSDTLIVPSDALIVAGNPGFYQVGSATPDTIDLSRPEGAAFSLVSVDLGPTGLYPTTALFTGTTATGTTVSESIDLSTAQGLGLETVPLTRFNDVTDMKFTEEPLGNSGSPTSIEFDNIVLGTAVPPPAPPAPSPLTSPIVLDDAAMVNADELPLISSNLNLTSDGTLYDYGSIAADGVTVTNIDRSDFAFGSNDSWNAATFGYFYDGPDVLIEPIAPNTSPSRIEMQRQDGGAFGISSIDLDTIFASPSGNVAAVFTGTTSSGSIVTETFELDNVQGFQTFYFDESFDDLKSLEFVGSGGTVQFDAITIIPPIMATAVAVNVQSVSVAENQSISESSIVSSLVNPSGDSITEYAFEDGGTVGHFTEGGTIEPDGQWIDVSASNLSSVQYVGGSSPGSETLYVEVYDATTTSWSAYSSLTATTIAPPVLSGGGNSVNYTPQGAAVAVDAGLAASDAGSATLAGATVAIGAGFFAGDALNFTNQNGIAGSYNATTGVLTLTGSASLANYQVALESITFSSTSGNPSDWDTDLSRTVRWTVTDGTQSSNTIASTIIVSAPPPSSTPAGTTADMILRDGTNGEYVIFDIGNNSILGANALGQVGPEWQVAGLGGFYGTDTGDMILRNSNTGAFEVYDISNNAITFATGMGQVGLEWTVAGLGDFSSRSGETDMLLRATSGPDAGNFEVYDISNNNITGAASLGQVGMEWQVAGFGDFSSRSGETDMLMRNFNTGNFEVYDINNNQITFAAAMGQVGLEWTVAGFGDLSGNANETDMLMRNSNSGAFELYDIANNQITAATSMGQVGLEWQVVGFGPLNGAGSSDMLMRNSNTGAFEVYDISNNAITSAASLGSVGLEWQVGGIAADPSTGSSAAAMALLVQAMAAFPSDGAALEQGPINQATQEGSLQPSLFAAPSLHHAV